MKLSKIVKGSICAVPLVVLGDYLIGTAISGEPLHRYIGIDSPDFIKNFEEINFAGSLIACMTYNKFNK
jgi:hypothetical protein